MILLKSNFRFSKILPPGEPFQARWSPAALEDSEDTLWCFSETLVPFAVAIPTTETSPLIGTYTCHPYLHSRLLLLVQDTLNYFPLFRESFVLTALQLLFLMNTCMNNSSPLLGIRSSPVVQVFRKILWNAIRSSEILSSLLLLIFFTCLHNGYFHMSSNIH